MRLFLEVKCQEQVNTLPSGIRKKVSQFLEKFLKNSKSAGIHLEPIKVFKDQSLKSARIDQTYRAIVKVSEKGDDYHLLWVDHHDKAYDWAQNKVVDYNKITNAWQIFSAVEDVVVERSNDNVDSRKQGLFSIYDDSQLLDIGVPDILMPAIRALKEIDDLERLTPHLPEGVFENLFYLLDGGSIDSIITEIREASETKSEETGQSIMDQRSFLEIPDNETLVEALSGDMLKWKHYLHESQALIVNKNYKGSYKLTGGAGTGKTVAALHRLRVLSQREQLQGRILFTTYTKALTENLSSLASSIGVKMSKVDISNLDSIAHDLAIKFGVISKNTKLLGVSSSNEESAIWQELIEEELVHYEVKFLATEFRDVVLLNDIKQLSDYLRVSRTGRGKAMGRRERKDLWQIIKLFREKLEERNILCREDVFNRVTEYLFSLENKPFEHVIVDELQDLSNVELRFIRALVKEGVNDLFLVGDPMQAIYQRNLNFSKAGIHIRGNRSKRLRINYRTTEEIKKVAISMVKSHEFDDFDGQEESKSGYISLMHGLYPTYEIFKNIEQELKFVVSSIKEAMATGFSPSEIVIAARRKKDLKPYRDTLHHDKIQYYEVHGDIKNLSLPGVRLSTLHSLKGLEFKLVYLVNVNNETCPWRPHNYNEWEEYEKRTHDKSESSIMYVAVSRAVERVIITGVGKKSELLAAL